jgi:hypothetical protein
MYKENTVMYNELQKRRYLENCKYEETTKETITMMFRGAARVEKRYKADLSSFNRPQVVELLKSYNSRSPHYLKIMCIYYADYYNWCLSEGLVDPSNVVNQYDSSLVKGIIKEIIPIELIKGKFYTKKDILEYLDCIIDISNKFLMWAIFIGIKGDNYSELSNLKMEDLDEENKVVKVGDRLHPVDNLFIELMKKTNEAKFYYPEGKLKDYHYNKNVYDESIYVLKNCRSGKVNTPVTKQYYTLRMRYIKMQTGNKFITASTLYRNGLINHIKEYYEAKGITLEEALFHEINNKLYTYDRETERVIKEFGSKMTVRMLRLQLKDKLEYYM